MNAETLLPIVDQIYAAAAREIALDDAFLSFARMMGDISLAMWVHDPVVGHTKVGAAAGVDRSTLDEYDARWSERNPLVQRSLPDLMAGEIVSADEILPWEVLRETDYYREFLRPLGMRHSLAALVAGKGQRYASLVTTRGEDAGPYKGWHREMVAAVRPHIARALHILEYFEGARINLAAFSATMDRLPFSVLLLDNHRRLLHANASAQRRLMHGDGIEEVDGRLEASGSNNVCLSFRRAWDALSRSELSSECRFTFESAQGAPLDAEASRILVSGAVIDSGRLWMLRLFDQHLDVARLTARWKAHLGFTPAQCRVAIALMEHSDAGGVAKALGLSVETVRSHLKAMFEKTGAHTQAALVLRLALEA